MMRTTLAALMIAVAGVTPAIADQTIPDNDMNILVGLAVAPQLCHVSKPKAEKMWQAAMTETVTKYHIPPETLYAQVKTAFAHQVPVYQRQPDFAAQLCKIMKENIK
jgi:hypothetical protein